MQINQTRKHVDRCFNHTAQAIEELKRGQSNGSTNTSNVKGIDKTGWFKRKKLLSLATTILQTLKSFLKAVGQIAMQSYEGDCFCKKKIKIEWMSEFIYNAHWPWVIPRYYSRSMCIINKLRHSFNFNFLFAETISFITLHSNLSHSF